MALRTYLHALLPFLFGTYGEINTNHPAHPEILKVLSGKRMQDQFTPYTL